MAKIYAPNKQYSGLSAGVVFVNGVGETDKVPVLDWFREHGYQVEEEEVTPSIPPVGPDKPEDDKLDPVEVREPEPAEDEKPAKTTKAGK